MRHALSALLLLLIPLSSETFGAEDILSILAERDDLSTYLLAVEATEFSQELQGDGPYTLFVANDFAFSKLHPENVDSLLLDSESLTVVLRYGLVPRLVLASDIRSMSSSPTAHGQALTFSKEGQRVDRANLVVTDLLATNGVVHVVDALIVPQEARQTILRGFNWR